MRGREEVRLSCVYVAAFVFTCPSSARGRDGGDRRARKNGDPVTGRTGGFPGSRQGHIDRPSVGGHRAEIGKADGGCRRHRSEEHTSELQSLMRISYAVFCLKQNNKTIHNQPLTLNCKP